MKINIQDVEVSVIDDDLYLQISDPSEADLYKIWAEITTSYPNYEKWLCFRNVEIPHAFLQEHNAILKDDCIRLLLYPNAFIYDETQTAEAITVETFPELAALHDQSYSDMYWTGERLGRDLTKWGIFCTRCPKGKISDYIIISNWQTGMAEIFCIHTTSHDNCKKLLNTAAKYGFDIGKPNVLYMADNIPNGIDHDTALAIGFVNEGFYQGYQL